MISRGIRILAVPLLKRRENVQVLQSVRTSMTLKERLHDFIYMKPPKYAFNYRDFPPPGPKWSFFAADFFNAFFWWWVFVHCYYQWGHIVGHYDYPVPEKWTDEQLGVVDEFD